MDTAKSRKSELFLMIMLLPLITVRKDPFHFFLCQYMNEKERHLHAWIMSCSDLRKDAMFGAESEESIGHAAGTQQIVDVVPSFQTVCLSAYTLEEV